MNTETNDILTTIMLMCYNLFLIVGTVWLIVELDWSPWWFLLTVLLLASKHKIKDDKSSN
jgi:hypothetical protein